MLNKPAVCIPFVCLFLFITGVPSRAAEMPVWRVIVADPRIYGDLDAAKAREAAQAVRKVIEAGKSARCEFVSQEDVDAAARRLGFAATGSRHALRYADLSAIARELHAGLILRSAAAISLSARSRMSGLLFTLVHVGSGLCVESLEYWLPGKTWSEVKDAFDDRVARTRYNFGVWPLKVRSTSPATILLTEAGSAWTNVWCTESGRKIRLPSSSGLGS